MGDFSTIYVALTVPMYGRSGFVGENVSIDIPDYGGYLFVDMLAEFKYFRIE
ncbi:hypothetical protein D3C74_483330 [compost metagenome]